MILHVSSIDYKNGDEEEGEENYYFFSTFRMGKIK